MKLLLADPLKKEKKKFSSLKLCKYMKVKHASHANRGPWDSTTLKA